MEGWVDLFKPKCIFIKMDGLPGGRMDMRIGRMGRVFYIQMEGWLDKDV